jgi:L-iditol 2-dehydrogenase
MKAAVLTGLRQMKLTDVLKPDIKHDSDVLLKIEVVGVCGSDVHYYLTGRIGSQVVKYPYLVGHECSATVEQVGKKVKKVKPGDEVAVEPAISCHKCPQCKMGRENTCLNLKFLGTPGPPTTSFEGRQGTNGCLCEYIVMPEDCCLPTKSKLTLEQAAVCEPFAIGVYTIKQSNLVKGGKIAILGSGPIGLSCLVAAKIQGADAIYMTDKLDYRADCAKKQGASWAGNPDRQNIVEEILRLEPLGVDIVCECAGKQETIDQAIDLLRPGGKLMLVGIPQFERFSFQVDKMRRKEIAIINVRRQNRSTEHAINLVAEGKAKIDFMITHRFNLEQAKDAFDIVADYRDGVIKAMIKV